MLVCNENLFIYAYGYCIYLACELSRSCCTPHKAIVEFRTSLLWSLYHFGCPAVVYTSLCRFLHVVLGLSFCSIAVLPTTLIFRTFARHSLFIFCIFYNALHILASSSSQRALLHSLQWYLDPIELDDKPHVLVITTLCTPFFSHILFSKKHSAPISLCSKLAKIVSTLRCFYHISRILQPKHHTAQKIHRFSRCMCAIPHPYLTFACKRDESGSHELSGHYFLRSRYSPLAVSTEITSPVLIKAGTLTTRPVSSVASLSTLLVVSPFTTSSV